MSGAFQYKPKFVDIRVRPPKPGEEAPPQDDVFTLKPGERACDNAGCRRPADARAPKHRDLPGEFYWFCPQHAAEYNKNWDYFAGMSEGQQRAFQEDALTGHRPTWSFKADSRSREAAAFAPAAVAAVPLARVHHLQRHGIERGAKLGLDAVRDGSHFHSCQFLNRNFQPLDSPR